MFTHEFTQEKLDSMSIREINAHCSLHNAEPVIYCGRLDGFEYPKSTPVSGTELVSMAYELLKSC